MMHLLLNIAEILLHAAWIFLWWFLLQKIKDTAFFLFCFITLYWLSLYLVSFIIISSPHRYDNHFEDFFILTGLYLGYCTPALAIVDLILLGIIVFRIIRKM